MDTGDKTLVSSHDALNILFCYKPEFQRNNLQELILSRKILV